RSGRAARARCWPPDRLPPSCVSSSCFPLAWIRCRDTAIHIEDIPCALARASRRREERDGLGDIFRQNIDPQGRALAIDFFELVGSHAIGCRPLFPPAAAPNTRA